MPFFDIFHFFCQWNRSFCIKHTVGNCWKILHCKWWWYGKSFVLIILFVIGDNALWEWVLFFGVSVSFVVAAVFVVVFVYISVIFSHGGAWCTYVSRKVALCCAKSWFFVLYCVASFKWYIYQNAWPNFVTNMLKLCLRNMRYAVFTHTRTHPFPYPAELFGCWLLRMLQHHLNNSDAIHRARNGILVCVCVCVSIPLTEILPLMSHNVNVFANAAVVCWWW